MKAVDGEGEAEDAEVEEKPIPFPRKPQRQGEDRQRQRRNHRRRIYQCAKKGHLPNGFSGAQHGRVGEAAVVVAPIDGFQPKAGVTATHGDIDHSARSSGCRRPLVHIKRIFGEDLRQFQQEGAGRAFIAQSQGIGPFAKGGIPARQK